MGTQNVISRKTKALSQVGFHYLLRDAKQMSVAGSNVKETNE